MKKWQDPKLTLGERCIAFSENELANGVAEDKPNSYTSPRIREYFKICTRIFNGKEVPVGLTFTKGNWCSAAASFTLHECLLPGETPPHGYRLGVVEIIADMQKLGTYRDVSVVQAGQYKLKMGDLIFFDRSRPNEPATAWYRHIGRVLTVDSDTAFTCISGNSFGKWRITKHTIPQAQLLGFGEYPTSTTVATPDHNVNMPWQSVNIEDLAPLENTGDNLEASDFWDLFGKVN